VFGLGDTGLFYSNLSLFCRCRRLVSVCALLLFFRGLGAEAQFLKLGPFDIDSTATLDAIYSSNVDNVRPSEATERMEDYYLVGRLSLNADAELGKHIRINSAFTLSQEKHFLRPDLDDRSRSDPFGQIDISTDMDFGRYVVTVFYKHESTFEQREAQFVEERRSKRTFRRSDDYGARLTWRRGRVDWQAGIRGARDRYVEDEFKDGDQDTAKIDFSISWQVTKRITTFYAYDRNRKKLINEPEEYDGWDDSHRVGTAILLLKRPNTTYSLAMVKQTSQGEEIGWEPAHTFSVSDALDLTKTLKLTGYATYTIKETQAADDIGFTYGANLDHQIARTAQQNLRATREPADTFGSSVDTDTTTVGYTFSKQDLFIYNLALTLGAQFKYSKPMGVDAGDPEKTWTYIGDLTWTRKVSRKMERAISYRYRRESSDVEDEDLQEHRVTVSYIYSF